jgi:hypothetical protein
VYKYGNHLTPGFTGGQVLHQVVSLNLHTFRLDPHDSLARHLPGEDRSKAGCTTTPPSHANAVARRGDRYVVPSAANGLTTPSTHPPPR